MTNSITTRSERLIPILEYEGRYSATSDGHIYSHITDKVLSEKPHSSGYSAISLMGFDGKRHDLLVHRLICFAFHGAPKQGQTDVNHINCDKKDNRPENLEWCSRSENMRHAKSMGLMERQSRAVSISNLKKSHPVAGFDASGNEVIRFPSVAEAKRNGYSSIDNALSGRHSTCHGLTWRRIQSYDEVGL
jgi:hypothetical protein